MADPQGTVLGPAILGESFRRNEEIEFVHDFFEKSDAYKQQFVPIWDEVFDNYLVAPLSSSQNRAFPRIGSVAIAPNPSPPGAQAVLKDPETHQIIETLATQAIGLLLSSRDYVTAVPRGIDDPDKARLLSRLIMAILEQPGWFRTQYQAFKNAFIFGTSILELSWETRSRMQEVKVQTIDETGQVVGVDMQGREVIYRDQPLLREIPIHDFYPDPSGTRIQSDMQGAGKRFRITEAQAFQLAEGTTYEMEATRRAFESGDSTESESEDERPGYESLTTRTVDAFNENTGFEYWGTVPFKRADGQNRVLTVINGELVRSRRNPFIDGGIPMKEMVVNPITGRFYGLSPAEVIRFLQDSADNMLMLFTDAADLAVRNVLLVGQTFRGDLNRLEGRKPNDAIPCFNPDAIKPLPVDLNSLQFSALEMGRRKFSMKESSGSLNPLAQTGDRSTATEISEVVRLASQRVELMVQLMEQDFYPWLGRTLHSRLRQFLPPGGAVASLNGEPLKVPLEAIDFESDVRFMGSRQATTKFQKAAQMRELLNVVGTNPDIVTLLPKPMTRYLRDILEFPDAEEIMQTAVQARQQMIQRELALAAQTQQAGSGSAPVASSEEAFGAVAGETEREGVALS